MFSGDDGSLKSFLENLRNAPPARPDAHRKKTAIIIAVLLLAVLLLVAIFFFLPVRWACPVVLFVSGGGTWAICVYLDNHNRLSLDVNDKILNIFGSSSVIATLVAIIWILGVFLWDGTASAYRETHAEKTKVSVPHHHGGGRR